MKMSQESNHQYHMLHILLSIGGTFSLKKSQID